MSGVVEGPGDKGLTHGLDRTMDDRRVEGMEILHPINGTLKLGGWES